MLLKKRYLKSKPVCKVTFGFNTEKYPEAKEVEISGNFTGWKPIPMRKVKGNFTRTIDLSVGSPYEFRYRVNGEVWINDEDADALVNNNLNGQNSLIKI